VEIIELFRVLAQVVDLFVDSKLWEEVLVAPLH
jgi:hypothetical protein